jgi:hypothetical protein
MANNDKKDAAQKPHEEKKEKTYTVKHGALIVGKNEKRNAGQSVKESELTKKELRFFLDDGTLREEAK